MALSPVTSADGPDAARAKVNAGLAEADKVASKADATALAALGGSVGTIERLFGDKADKTALAAEVTRATAAETANTKAISDEVTARTTADTSLSNRLDGFTTLISPNADLIGGASDRPGDSRSLFTRVMTGEPKGRAIIDRGTIVTNDDMGQALRIAATDVDANPGFIDIAPRRSVFFRPFRTYIARFAFARVANPTDPSQNAVEARIQNLSSSFAQVSTARLGLFTPVVADGVVYADILIGKAGAPGNLVYTIPDTSRYGVPYLRIYGNGQTTDVGAIAVYDVTDGLLGGADIAGLTARISTFEARIKAIEGATGIDPTLISGLAADRDAVRFTRYYARPGNAPRTWTADLKATPAAAVPLALSTQAAPNAYSLVDTLMGKALRITGVASARPIVQVPLDDTQVEEFKVIARRGVDSTNAADNAPVFSFACFKSDNTDNGTVSLPADQLTAAQGFKTYTFRASLVPGLGTVNLPAGTRFVNLVPGGKGNGAVDIVSVERGPIPPSLASLIQASTLAQLIASTATFGFELNGQSYRVPFTGLTEELRKVLKDPVYTSFETIQVGLTSKILRGIDPDLRKVQWQPAAGNVAASASGLGAKFDMSAPSTISYDGGVGELTFGLNGCDKPLAFAATVAGPVTLAIERAVASPYVKGNLFADDLMSYWPDQNVDPRFRNAMRVALNLLNEDALIGTSGDRKLRMLHFVGASEANNKVNLFDPLAAKNYLYVPGSLGIATVPYYATISGGDGWIDTQVTSDDLAWEKAGHLMICKAGIGANPDPDGVQMSNSASFYLSSQLTNTYGAARTGGSRETIPSTPGQMIGFSRNSDTEYTQYVEGELVQTIQRVAIDTIPTRNLILGGIPAGFGAVGSISKLPLRMAVAGGKVNNPIQAMRRVYQRFQPVLDVCDQIRANP